MRAVGNWKMRIKNTRGSLFKLTPGLIILPPASTCAATHGVATAAEATAETTHRMATMEATDETANRGVVVPHRRMMPHRGSMPQSAATVTMPSPRTAETPKDPKNDNHSQHFDALLSWGSVFIRLFKLSIG